MPIVNFDSGYATHRGMVRTNNEDHYVVLPNSGVWAVCDGMGGHNYGDVASGLLAEKIGSIGRPISASDLLARFEDRIFQANSAIVDFSHREGGITVGSTLAALLVYKTDYACVWSGDSRIYRIRNRILEQLTRDHTEVQELLDQKLLTVEEAKNWPRSNVITKAIGVTDEPDLELTRGRLLEADRFLLCSDGLTAHMEDHEIAQIVGSKPPQLACDALIQKTLERGASDNVTVVVLHHVPDQRSMKQKRPTDDFWD